MSLALGKKIKHKFGSFLQVFINILSYLIMSWSESVSKRRVTSKWPGSRSKRVVAFGTNSKKASHKLIVPWIKIVYMRIIMKAGI